MTYINPLAFLEIETVVPSLVEKAKYRKLVEIERSVEGYISYGTHAIKRVDLLRLVEELRDEQKASYHAFIYSQKALLQFLTWEDIRFFEIATNHELYGNRSFLNFVGPYFAKAYQRVLTKAYEQKDAETLLKLQRTSLLLLPIHERNIYRKIEQHIAQVCDDLKLLYQKLNFASHIDSSTSPKTILTQVVRDWSPSVVNALPIHFEEQRSRLASLLANLSVTVYNRFPSDDEVFYALIEMAIQLKTNAGTKSQIRKDYTFLRSKMQERNATKIDALSTAIQQMIDQLNAIRLGKVATAARAQGVLNMIRSIVDIDLVNQLSFGGEQIKSKLASTLKQVAIFVWEKYADFAIYEKIIYLTLEIDLGVDQTNSLIELRQKKSRFKLNKGHNFEVLVIALASIREAIQSKDYTDAEQYAKTITNLLSDFFRPDLCQILQKDEEKRVQVTEFLLPILNFLRRLNPIAVLELLDQIERIAKEDTWLRQRLESVNDQLLQELKNTPQRPANALQRKANTQLSAVQNRLSALLSDIAEFFFSDVTKGAMRYMAAGIVFSLVCMTTLIFKSAGELINQPVVGYEASVPAYVYVDPTEKVIKELEQRKNEFKGKQLKTGATPFERCFGTGLRDKDTENELVLENHSPYDAIAVVKTADSLVTFARHTYIRSGEFIRLKDLPEGEYKLYYYLGKDWAAIKPNACNLHGAFYTNPHYRALTRRVPLVFETKTTHTITLDEANSWGNKTFFQISARSFFKGEPKK